MALEFGQPTCTKTYPTIADGLAVPKVGFNAFATAKDLLEKVIVVNEKWISLAILRLVEEEKVVVEGAGAAGLAAVLSGQLDEFKGKKVVLLLCGGNIDSSALGNCIERGLATDGRLSCATIISTGKVTEEISDICEFIRSCDCRVKDFKIEKDWMQDFNTTRYNI